MILIKTIVKHFGTNLSHTREPCFYFLKLRSFLHTVTSFNLRPSDFSKPVIKKFELISPILVPIGIFAFHFLCVFFQDLKS